ncbi:hypothetical protein BRO54_3169 [Geobacillus proteiniphilus]|uniref:Uncharacterized protein n=1 Tax=Geobacillus proteiniphilus TaxID=860353 RepID=A0A1Q5SPT5_9BACL|nr:hypothetical protein BRO54_3169 [Geobacillus proteiniphilus]
MGEIKAGKEERGPRNGSRFVMDQAGEMPHSSSASSHGLKTGFT